MDYMKRRWTKLVLVIAVLAVIAYFFRGPVMQALRPADPTQLTAGEMATIITVGRGDIFRFMTASGNLQPIRKVDMRFSTSGRVEEVYVQEGDRVSRGDELVRLDNRQQELAYLKAKTNYELALIDSPPNVIQEREYDMNLAWDTLQNTILRAPFDGLITAVHVEPGQTVGTSDVVVQLIDDSVYKVDVSIDELDIAQLKVGQRATVTLDADRSRPHSGYVHRIGYVANVSSNIVTVPVTIHLDSVDPMFRPGYTATVQIAVAEARNVVRIPVEAIDNQTGVNVVTKIVDDEPVPVVVQTGISDGVWVEVVSGLEPGDKIVGLNYRGTSSGRFQPGQGGSRGFTGGSPIPGFNIGIRR